VVTNRTGITKTIDTPIDFPELADLASGKYEVQEPLIKATIIVPEEFVGNVMELCSVRFSALKYHTWG
jgi:translation elongation factor EF-4